jgi:hypothetical protein
MGVSHRIRDRRHRNSYAPDVITMASVGANASRLSIAALFGVAAAATVAPVRFSAAYGLPLEDDNRAAQGYVRALGARDATLAAIALYFAARGERSAVRVDLSVVVSSDSRGNVALAAAAAAGAFALLLTSAICE